MGYIIKAELHDLPLQIERELLYMELNYHK